MWQFKILRNPSNMEEVSLQVDPILYQIYGDVNFKLLRKVLKEEKRLQFALEFSLNPSDTQANSLKLVVLPAILLWYYQFPYGKN